jgi:membrane-bound ClpP family serine protease
MLTAAPTRAPARSPALLIAAAAFALSGLLWPHAARGADEPAAGLTVQFPAVITEDVTTRLRAAVYVPLKRYQEEQQRQGKPTAGFKLLCDFNPQDNRADATDDFGACYLLAKELRALQQKGVRTRAWVHGDVSRHAVLPVLACGEIVMSADPAAHIGRVVDADRHISDTEKTAYEELPGAPYAPAIVRKMYDRDLVVVKVFPVGNVGARYLDKKEADAAKLNAQEWDGPHAGEVAFYDVKKAGEYGLCKPDPQNTLADALGDFGLPRSSVYPLLDRTTAVRVTVRGDIDGELKEDVERRLDRALGEKANVIILQLECGGGDDQTAYDLAQFIAGLKDRADRPVKTIAYVASPATDTSLFLALACDQIAMQKDAHLGDFQGYLQGHPERLETMAKNLHTAAERGGYPPALAEGMVRSDVQLVQAEAAKGAGEVRVLTDKEVADDEKSAAPHGWQVKATVKPAGPFLRLDADDARKYGLAEAVVNNYDELCAVENVRPADLEGDWLNALAEFLRNPWTSVVLVMIGVTCLIIELKMPGASLPGVIAAVCFVLFFWSQSQVAGQITWLAVLLFILGLVLIGIEVFVLPGTGVCGISGAILALGGLALVAFGHWPQTSEDWAGFGQKLGPFGAGILAAIVLAFILVRYLKHIPYLNRLILKPPAEAAADGEAPPPEPVHPELASLLGAIGVAATPLRPAGKTQFGDQFVDVVAEGGFVHPGARVQVVEIEGNRVVVKEV